MAENIQGPPPPVLDCARVLRYVTIDESIEFSGRSLLFVDGKELGEVPCLAICEKAKSGGVLLFHCTRDWTVLGCSVHKTIMEAQVRAEGVYKGTLSRWVDANVSPERAEAYLDEMFGRDRCSACGKRFDQVDSLIKRGSVLICNYCVGNS